MASLGRHSRRVAGCSWAVYAPAPALAGRQACADPVLSALLPGMHCPVMHPNPLFTPPPPFNANQNRHTCPCLLQLVSLGSRPPTSTCADPAGKATACAGRCAPHAVCARMCCLLLGQAAACSPHASSSPPPSTSHCKRSRICPPHGHGCGPLPPAPLLSLPPEPRLMLMPSCALPPSLHV